MQRIVASGERNARITRAHASTRRSFAEEAALILGILNDAWSDNWGFVPLTDSEIAYAGKKLKPIVFEDLIMVAEVDGEPVAFMMTLPDLNEKLRGFGGSLFPFNWLKLLWWLRKPKVRTMRVPLMGVVKRLQATRLASQLAFMMIEYIRREAITHLWRDARRDRLDPRGQSGHGLDRRDAQRQDQPHLPDLREGSVATAGLTASPQARVRVVPARRSRGRPLRPTSQTPHVTGADQHVSLRRKGEGEA